MHDDNEDCDDDDDDDDDDNDEDDYDDDDDEHDAAMMMMMMISRPMCGQERAHRACSFSGSCSISFSVKALPAQCSVCPGPSQLVFQNELETQVILLERVLIVRSWCVGGIHILYPQAMIIR